MIYKGTLYACICMMICLMLTGCGGGGGGSNTPELTPEQIAEISQAGQAITDKITGSSDPHSDATLEEAKAFAETQPVVEGATISDQSLIVKYRDTGFQVWMGNEPPDLPPADIEALYALTSRVISSATRSPVGTRKAVIINAFSEDPNRTERLAYFQEIMHILEAEGFQVLSLTERTATPSALRALKDYSVILHSGHGGRVEGYWSFNFPYAVMAGFWSNDYISDWRANRVVKMTSVDGRGDFYGTTGRFWEDTYSSGHFNHALFMNLACSSSKYEAYRQCLFDVGVAAYTGWSEPQGRAAFTAWRILATMADEKTLQQAVDAMPDWYKTDHATGYAESSFWYGPDNQRDITLGGIVQQGPQVIITTPADGETIVDRQCEVRGNIQPWSGSLRATVNVNGQSTALVPDSDGYFNQPVGLRAGPNLIRVSVIGTQETSSEVSVNGQFTSDILYTTLWWNQDLNDIDFHLSPVEGTAVGQTECYFGNKTTTWGAMLDVDDVDGYGPEHITARTLPSGKYLLYVYYYATHEQTNPSVVNVAVSANGSPSVIYSLPSMLNWGDRWNVCYISYPSGTIETINQFIPATRGAVCPYPAKPAS